MGNVGNDAMITTKRTNMTCYMVHRTDNELAIAIYLGFLACM